MKRRNICPCCGEWRKTVAVDNHGKEYIAYACRCRVMTREEIKELQAKVDSYETSKE